MMALIESVYGQSIKTIGELSRASLKACCEFYGLNIGTTFVESWELGVNGASSQRVLDIVKTLGGKKYITGLGARNYLDHQIFEEAGVRVEYMDYQKIPYNQLHGDFTPYVSILDLIANRGKGGVEVIQSGTIYWKDYLKHE
jgi:hypothetical protein